MRRCTLLLSCLALGAPLGCGLEEIDAILAKYDTFGSTGTGDTSTSTGGQSSTEAQTDSTDGPGDGTSSTSSGEGLADTGVETTGSGSTTEAEMGSSETTQDPGAVCGDGVKQEQEECDDGNLVEADGCLSNCTREWFVFVTSEPYTQGNIKGLVGADYECRHRATKMFLPNGERYMAWISTSTVQPVDRLYHARGPYKLLDGVRVAASWDALVAGPLEHPISLSELGEFVNAPVFTGTLPSGERVPGSDHCDDWTDADGKSAWIGASVAVEGDWTATFESDCGPPAGLYCFEQP